MGRRKKKKPWKKHLEAEGGHERRPEPNPLLHALPDASLDLHGRTVAEAEAATRNFLVTQSRLGAGRIVHVVTGKGTGRLYAAVGRLLDGPLERWVDDAAPDLAGAGWRVRVA